MGRELDLAKRNPGEVIRVLGPRLSEERKRRIDEVAANRTGMLAIAMEDVHDPHNTAAVIRTADAFGILQMHIIEGNVKFRSSRKVTQGAHKWVDIGIWSSAELFIEAMKVRGMKVLVAAMDGTRSVRDLSPIEEPTVLVFGNESEGISEAMLACADGTFRIPMYGFVESFNISVAAGISISTLRAGGGGDLCARDLEVLRARYYLRSVRAGYDIVKLTVERGR